MLKWIGRILYVIVVFLFVTTVGIGDGIVFSEYYEKVVLTRPEDIDYTISTYLGMDHSYYQKESILDSAIEVDATRNDINIKFDLELYPLGSPKTNFEENNIFDGLIFVMTNIENSDNFVLSHFSVKFKVRNTITNDISDLYILDDSYLYIIIPPSNELIAGAPKGLLFVTEYSMKTVDSRSPIEAEYEILTIDIFGHGHLVSDETRKDQNLHLYKGYKDGQTGDGNPIVIDNNLVINREDYLLSEITNISDLPTEAEIETFNLGFIMPDYSPYFYWFWIIGFLYVGLLFVIPYFWFFHPKVMENYRARKRVRLLAQQRKLNKNSTVVEAEVIDKKNSK